MFTPILVIVLFVFELRACLVQTDRQRDRRGWLHNNQQPSDTCNGVSVHVVDEIGQQQYQQNRGAAKLPRQLLILLLSHCVLSLGPGKPWNGKSVGTAMLPELKRWSGGIRWSV